MQDTFPFMTRSSLIMFLIALVTLIMPVSISFWIISLVGSKRNDLPSPLRWFTSLIVPTLVLIFALTKNYLDYTACLLSFFIGFIIILSNYCFFIIIIVFFLTCSHAPKLFANLTRRHKEKECRNWAQVICNAGIPFQFATFYMLEKGIGGETPINFAHDYSASSLAMSILGSVACANADTWASEIAPSFCDSDPLLITTWKRVPKGTNGGITFAGLVISFLGGLTIGLSYYIALFIFIDSDVLAISPPQWPVVLIGGISGFLGSLVDSILGATLQYSGLDEEGHVVEYPEKSTKWISGIRFFDNNSVNLLSCLIMALATPKFAIHFWL